MKTRLDPFVSSIDDAVTDYSWKPANFGPENEILRIASGDGFRAGAEWAMQHIDWRVLAGVLPGPILAGRMRLHDRVVVADIEGEVVLLSTAHGRVHFTVRTDRGAEIVFERPEMAAVMVLDVGRSG